MKTTIAAFLLINTESSEEDEVFKRLKTMSEVKKYRVSGVRTANNEN